MTNTAQYRRPPLIYAASSSKCCAILYVILHDVAALPAGAAEQHGLSSCSAEKAPARTAGAAYAYQNAASASSPL